MSCDRKQINPQTGAGRVTLMVFLAGLLLTVTPITVWAGCDKGNCTKGYGTFSFDNGDVYTGLNQEVLYQEKMIRGQTYIYRPDPLSVSGRLCALCPE